MTNKRWGSQHNSKSFYFYAFGVSIYHQNVSFYAI